jgi:hypothetical protein
MPRKTFTAGEVLAAADVNEYLMDQSVMTFADSGARGSAIGTAIAQEGMLTYLEDTDAFEYWDGSAFTAFGGGGGAATTNAIINGAFEINQRKFTSSTAGGYGFDRWTTARVGGTVTASSQAFTLGTAPVAGFEAANFSRHIIAGQSASGDIAVFIQPIEGVRSFAGQTVTISFYAKADSGTPKIGLELYQEFGTGGSPSSFVSTVAGDPTISTSWARYTVTVAVPSIAGKTIGTDNNDSLQVGLWLSAGSTFNSRSGSIGLQNNTFDIWGVQVESGSTATDFRRNANSLQGELAACQRYYYRVYGGEAGEPYGMCAAFSTTNARAYLHFPTTMRARPTVFETSNTLSNYRLLFTGLGAVTPTFLGVQSYNTSGAEINWDASGYTVGRAGNAQSASTAGFFGFGAEL